MHYTVRQNISFHIIFLSTNVYSQEFSSIPQSQTVESAFLMAVSAIEFPLLQSFQAKHVNVSQLQKY